MLTKLLIALAFLALCVGIHAAGLVAIFRWLEIRVARGVRGFWPSTWWLVQVAAWTVGLHLIEIFVWACLYALGKAMPDFTAAAYFSAVTYTTTGYGDLVLPPDWRLVGGVEALTGIFMCGLSTGMFFAVFSLVFGLQSRAPAKS